MKGAPARPKTAVTGKKPANPAAQNIMANLGKGLNQKMENAARPTTAAKKVKEEEKKQVKDTLNIIKQNQNQQNGQKPLGGLAPKGNLAALLKKNLIDKVQSKMSMDEFLKLIKSMKDKGKDPVFTIQKDFTIDITLGKGAFGTVKKAKHNQSGYEVALKTYEKKQLTRKEQLMMIHREIYILAGMSHPNIMHLFEVIDSPKQCHLVMELCEGRDLYSYITKKAGGRLSEKDAAPIFKQIVSAVQYMHNIGLCHRDLKLENILFNGNTGVVKLIDFGFATQCKKGHKLSQYCGTPCYMDPDLIREKKYMGQPADVWALGVILYLMVTGGVPFWSPNNHAETKKKICSGAFSFSKAGYSKKIKDLLSAIFNPKSEQRITAEGILKNPWITSQCPDQKVIKKTPKIANTEMVEEEEKVEVDDGPGPGEYIPTQTIGEKDIPDEQIQS